MARRRRKSTERYHDRVAGIYDAMYDGSPYWEAYRAITWRHVKRFLPDDLSTRILDVGCGTGYWGLRLAKSGFAVDFLDISQKMLDAVSRKLEKNPPARETRLIHADIADLSALPPDAYDLVIGQGDPLSCASDLARALAEMTRILAPGGVMIQSVDNRHAAHDHFLDAGDLPGLERFLRDGRTEWLTDRAEERHDLVTFTPPGLRSLFERAGYEILDLIGKTVLPLRRLEREGSSLLADRASRERLVRIEESLHRETELLGRAAHLEIAAKLTS